MAKKRRAGPVEAYAVLVVAMVAVVGLVSLYLLGASGGPIVTGQIVYGLDQGTGIARLPRISMSCEDMDVHLKMSQIYTPAKTIGTNKLDGVVGVFNDYCDDEKTLVENYCRDGKVTQQNVVCSSGCKDWCW